MEETKTTKIKKSRMNCMNGQCARTRKQYCKDHDMIVCSKCYTALHVKCHCEEIIHKEDVKDCIDLIKNLLISISGNNKTFRVSCYTKDFDSEIKSFTDSLASIDNKLSAAIKNDAFIQYRPIMNDLVQLQRSLVDSNSFIEYSKLMILQSAAMGVEVSSSDLALVHPSADENEIKKIQEKLAVEMEKNKIAELKEAEEEMKKKLIEENKERIVQLEATITQLNEKNADLTLDNKKQFDAFEEKIKILKDTYKEENLKLKEKNEQDQNQISYIRNLMEYNAFSSSRHFVMNIDNSTCASFADYLTSKKLRLPNMDEIIISKLCDGDKQLNNFFKYCCPFKIKDMNINTENESEEGIKLSYYINSLVKAISGVSNIFKMKYFDVSEEDLQQIIKASANAKCVYLDDCDIHCSKPLDFSTQSIYKTEELSFEGCGDGDRKSDWIADPSLFENIVEAISKCGLKDSLKIVYIENCKLKELEMKKIFEKYGMANIKIDGIEINIGMSRKNRSDSEISDKSDDDEYSDESCDNKMRQVEKKDFKDFKIKNNRKEREIKKCSNLIK